MSTDRSVILQHLLSGNASATENARARVHALGSVTGTTPVVSSVSYHSRGWLLVLGPAARVTDAAQRLAGCEQLHLVLLITDSERLPGTLDDGDGIRCVHGSIDSLNGYLGNFIVDTCLQTLATALKLSLPEGQKCFDLVLDMSEQPMISSEIAPPGYYAPGASDTAVLAAITEIPALVGEFEKPRYFRYNAAICAHGRSGVSGCTRCIETCPTDAISSNGDVIEVNPNLCQGAGSCATACPAGAIRYGYPTTGETLQYWRSLLTTYREAGGEQPVLLVHDAQSGSDLVAGSLDTLADNVLPVEVEELGSVGIDAWLAALAWGADAVKLLSTQDVAPSVNREIDFQLEIANRLITGPGYAGKRLARLTADELDGTGSNDSRVGFQAPATFAALEEKRTLTGLALDHLTSQRRAESDAVTLPQGAPFGEIQVNPGLCTLCMACVSQCPANALAAGDESPQLRFIEANCVQCGLCSRSCPEQAISLSPRFVSDANRRRQTRTLHEEAPFCCIRCNKPFATRSVISKITDRMKDHPMFSGDALDRLKMCEDCRIKDMYLDQIGTADGLHSGDQE